MPTAEQLDYLVNSSDPRPLVAVNLLKFKPQAEYSDGRQTGLTGLEAFMIYSKAMKPIVEGFGGNFLVSVLVDRLVIGGGSFDWDRISLVGYPSRAVFAQVMASPKVKAAAIHRHAGLEGQLNVISHFEDLADPSWGASSTNPRASLPQSPGNS